MIFFFLILPRYIQAYLDIDAVCTSHIDISIVKPFFPKWRMLLFLVTDTKAVLTAIMELQKEMWERKNPSSLYTYAENHRMWSISRVAVGDPGV